MLDDVKEKNVDVFLEPIQFFHLGSVYSQLEPDICHMLLREPLRGLDDALFYINDFNSTQPVRYAIIHRAFGFIGGINFGRIMGEYPSAEIGFWLGKKYQGKGFAKLAIDEVTKILIKLDIHRVYAEVEPKNTASLRLLERKGFKAVSPTLNSEGLVELRASLSHACAPYSRIVGGMA